MSKHCSARDNTRICIFTPPQFKMLKHGFLPPSTPPSTHSILPASRPIHPSIHSLLGIPSDHSPALPLIRGTLAPPVSHQQGRSSSQHGLAGAPQARWRSSSQHRLAGAPRRHTGSPAPLEARLCAREPVLQDANHRDGLPHIHVSAAAARLPCVPTA